MWGARYTLGARYLSKNTVIPICLGGESDVECCFWDDDPGLNFTCTSCFICHYASQTVETFHILLLFLICRTRNLYWGWLP